MAEGLLLVVVVDDASVELGCRFGVCGEGENSFSEKLELGDEGEVFPPQPKNVPSLEAPGDFCGDLL